MGTRDPLTHFTLYSSGIPHDFLVHNLCNSVARPDSRDEQTTSEMHIFPWDGRNSIEILGKKD